MLADEVRAVRFRKAPIGRRGYDEEQVDEFLDRIEGALRGRSAMTLGELRDTRIGRSPVGKRGYRDEDVDAFVERVIAEWPGPSGRTARSVTTLDTTQGWLAGLAQDVFEHEACFDCRCKAAAALEHLGVLHEVLTRIGKVDPRRQLPAEVGSNSPMT